MFKNRSAIEIMVIVFVFLLAFSVVFTSCFIAVLKLKDPQADVNTAVASLTSVVSAILAALLGLVAGRSDALMSSNKRPDEEGQYTVYERPEEHPRKKKPRPPDPDAKDDEEEMEEAE